MSLVGSTSALDQPNSTRFGYPLPRKSISSAHHHHARTQRKSSAPAPFLAVTATSSTSTSSSTLSSPAANPSRRRKSSGQSAALHPSSAAACPTVPRLYHQHTPPCMLQPPHLLSPPPSKPPPPPPAHAPRGPGFLQRSRTEPVGHTTQLPSSHRSPIKSSSLTSPALLQRPASPTRTLPETLAGRREDGSDQNQSQNRCNRSINTTGIAPAACSAVACLSVEDPSPTQQRRRSSLRVESGSIESSRANSVPYRTRTHQNSIYSFAWPQSDSPAATTPHQGGPEPAAKQQDPLLCPHEDNDLVDHQEQDDVDDDDDDDNVSLLEIPVHRESVADESRASSPSAASESTTTSPLPSEYSWALVSVRSNTSLSWSRSASIVDADAASTLDSAETRTLESSITRFRSENGRTYHSYGSTEHWGPNDERAQEQQDISHHFFTILIDGRLFTAPIGKPTSILDLGTGTGIWALDVADAYPDAYVKGIDLSPIQPVQTAPNCHFEIDDYNLEFVDRHTYDLIHQRELLGTVPKWEDFYRKCFQALRPGGWIDITEPDSTRHYCGHDFVPLPEDHLMNLYLNHLNQAGRNHGMVFDIAPRIEELLRKVGFVNVKVTKMQAPVGTWARSERLKEIGAWNQLRCEEGISDWTMRRFTTELGWTKDEVVVLAATIRRGYRDKAMKMGCLIYNVIGQKPSEQAADVSA